MPFRQLRGAEARMRRRDDAAALGQLGQHGRAGSMPMPGCRNRIGRPAALDGFDGHAIHDQRRDRVRHARTPRFLSAPLSIARAQAVFQDHAATRVQRKGTSGWIRPKSWANSKHGRA
jgi:hypothetical protein